MSTNLDNITTLFLGGKEKTTLKEMSELLGKETIDSFNTSETRGRELSHGLNYQKLGKELMRAELPEVRQGAYDAGRNRRHGRREMQELVKLFEQFYARKVKP